MTSGKLKVILSISSRSYRCVPHKAFPISPQEISCRISQWWWSITSNLPACKLPLLLGQESRYYAWNCASQQNWASVSAASDDDWLQDLSAGTLVRMMALTPLYSTKGNNLYTPAVSRGAKWRQWAEQGADWLGQILIHHGQFLYVKPDTQGVIFFWWIYPFPGQQISYIGVANTPLCNSSSTKSPEA